MLRRSIFISIILALLTYLFFAVFIVSPKAEEEICHTMDIVVTDTLERHFIKKKDVELMIKKASLSPFGKKMKDIDTDQIEKTLLENKLIKKAECYKTTGGTLKVEVYQKMPIIRVIAGKNNYYLDLDGEIMPLASHFAAFVPVATGNIDEQYAKNDLYDFAKFIQSDPFWKAQIEQINIRTNKDVELTPRVGNHQILLGKMENYKENLEKLKLFYEKGLNEIGWNRYSFINLKYENQVVCTKK